MQNEIRRIDDLNVHPLLNDSPMLAEDHPDCLAIRESIQTDGLDGQPIVINDQNEVLDGRHRVREAKTLGMTEVPVVVRSPVDAGEAIARAVMARRHMMKWQIAYCLAPGIEASTEDGKTHRQRNLKRGQKHQCSPDSASGKMGIRDVLASWNISQDAWQRIRNIRIAFKKHPELKERFEPRMFTQDSKQFMDPQAVVRAIGSITGAYGSDQKPDLKKARTNYPHLIWQWMSKATTHFKHWEHVPSSAREKLTVEITDLIRTWPEDVRKALRKNLKD